MQKDTLPNSEQLKLIRHYQKLSEQGRLFGILCKNESLPDYLLEICGEVSQISRIRFDLDEWYICAIGKFGFWVSINDLIIIEK